MPTRTFPACAAFAFALVASATVLPLAGCSSSKETPTPQAQNAVDSGVTETGDPDAGETTADAQAADAADASLDRGVCASTFGSALTASFGRIDGTVVAVQIPADKACTLPNSDHVIVQVSMGGAIYRLVVNVQSDRGGPDIRVRYAETSAPLLAPAFAEGWHTGITLDYATNLALHSTAFTPMTMDEAVAKLASTIKVGEHIAIYGTCGAGRPDSAHLIHRQGNGDDGALVLQPESATPTWATFSFLNLTF